MLLPAIYGDMVFMMGMRRHCWSEKADMVSMEGEKSQFLTGGRQKPAE